MNIKFHKQKLSKDSLRLQYVSGRKEEYNENQEKTKNWFLENQNRNNEYYLGNHDGNIARQNEYTKNRKDAVLIFRSVQNTRQRLHHALKVESKSSSTLVILGLDIQTFEKRMNYQTSPEMNWSNIRIDYIKLIYSIVVFEDGEVREVFNWKTQTS